MIEKTAARKREIIVRSFTKRDLLSEEDCRSKIKPQSEGIRDCIIPLDVLMVSSNQHLLINTRASGIQGIEGIMNSLRKLTERLIHTPEIRSLIKVLAQWHALMDRQITYCKDKQSLTIIGVRNPQSIFNMSYYGWFYWKLDIPGALGQGTRAE